MLRHSRGLALLAHLVQCPERDVHVLQLDAMTPSGGAAADGLTMHAPGDAGELLDARARRAYRDRVADLRSNLEEAEARHDLGQAETIRAEVETLVERLRATRGAFGRHRRASADADRIRQAIRRALRTAIAKVARHHPALGLHLEHAVFTGYHCAYAPGRR